MRRVDLVGVDEVPDGTMQLVWVDGTDPVLVVNVGGEIRAMQGICSHEYFELDKGFLTGGGSRGVNGREAGTLTCALHLSRFDCLHISHPAVAACQFSNKMSSSQFQCRRDVEPPR